MHFHVKKTLVICILLKEKRKLSEGKNLLGLSVSLYSTKNEDSQCLKITQEKFVFDPTFEKLVIQTEKYDFWAK